MNALLLLSSIQTSKVSTRPRTNLVIHHQSKNSQHQLENLFTLSVILCRTKGRPSEWPNSQKGTLALCFPFRKMERRGFSRWWRRQYARNAAQKELRPSQMGPNIPHKSSTRGSRDRDIVRDKGTIEGKMGLSLAANCAGNSSNNRYLQRANSDRCRWRNSRLLDHPGTPQVRIRSGG